MYSDKLIFLLVVTFITFSSHAENSVFLKATKLHKEGKYQATVDELNKVQSELRQNGKDDSKSSGFIYYWRGIALNRLQNYDEAIKNLKQAITLNYAPLDINYELGQAYFAMDKLYEARFQFTESLKRSFKKTTSLYYMGYISKELGDKNNAKYIFQNIKDFEDSDSPETWQASRMQLADMELEEAEKSPDAIRRIDKVVIPLYEKALESNKKSALAPKIKSRIIDLQKKYQLVLFQMRNGRPTLIPPYFLRVAQEVGFDSNVTFTPEETTIAEAKQGSSFSKSEVFGRYTFYYKDYLSFAPELRFNFTRYMNRVPEIYRNDNYLLAPALRGAYEHSFRNKPAALLFDYDLNEANRDVEAKEKLIFSSRSHTFSLGEKFNIFSFGETILRLRRREFQSFISASNSQTTSFILEQFINLPKSIILMYVSHDRTRVRTDIFNTDATTVRADWILPQFKTWFSPVLSFAATFTDPFNDRENRGLETLWNPGLRLTRKLNNHFNLNGRFEHQLNKSRDDANFSFRKNLAALELEYIF